MTMAAWTTPQDIRAQVSRLWDRGRILSARVTGETVFPFAARLVRPGVRDLSDDFAAAREWIASLAAGGKPAVPCGYEIEWEEINHRQLGKNRIPRSVVIPTEEDALAFIGKRREADRFDDLVRVTLEARPELLPWIAKYPFSLLEHAGDWARLLALVDWFLAHPRPGVYTRQIDLPGVHTKFVERHRGLLGELLDLVLPAEAVDARFVGAAGFEARYGLRRKPVLVRFRILDDRQAIAGLTDLSVPVEQFAQLSPTVSRVFITENKINGLAFPPVPGAMVIFGLGYGLDRLADVPWLRRTAVSYWGDLDTHGFAMLDALRAFLPHAESFLMDRETLLAHVDLWGAEPEPTNADLSRLTDDERAVYDGLRTHAFGASVRLEQERIGFDWLERALRPIR